MISNASLLVVVPDWWQEGDHALGAALVAAKATEVRMTASLQRHPNDLVLAKLQARAKSRALALEQAVSEWKKMHDGDVEVDASRQIQD
jgi:hypothetical protein